MNFEGLTNFLAALLAIIFGLLMVAIPFYIAFDLGNNFQHLDTQGFRDSFGTLYQDIKANNKLAI